MGKKRLRLLQLILSFGLLAILFWRIGLQDILKTLQDIDLRWYLPAFFLFIVNIFIRAFRWYTLSQSIDKRPSFLTFVAFYFIGFFANNFLPSSFGGDVVKAAYLRQETGKGANALSSVIMDRATGLLGTTLIALLALLFNRSALVELSLPSGLWWASAIICIGFPLGFVTLRWFNPFAWLGRLVPRLGQRSGYAKAIEFADTVKQYQWLEIGKAILVSLPFTLNRVIIQYFIARALAVQLPFTVFLLFAPLIALITLLPFSFNGLGVRETLYPFLFVPLGVTEVTAVAMALAFSLLRLSAGLIGGILFGSRALYSAPQAPSMVTNKEFS